MRVVPRNIGRFQCPVPEYVTVFRERDFFIFRTCHALQDFPGCFWQSRKVQKPTRRVTVETEMTGRGYLTELLQMDLALSMVPNDFR